MTDNNAVSRYIKLDEKCDALIAQISPFLQNFAREHDTGTCFYSDITVLYGPGACEYNHFAQKYPDLFNAWREGKISVYNLKWGGATFVIEYDFNRFHEGKIYPTPIPVPCRAFMIHRHQQYDVPMSVAIAVRDLCEAQEARSVVHAAHKKEIVPYLEQRTK